MGQAGADWAGAREERWAAGEREELLGWFVLFQSLFYLLFYFSNLNLFEFKTKFEFNPRHSLK
jgi:hypothetical protein